MKEFYVYAHKRASDNTVFYIGKGAGSRIDSNSGRNSHWKNTKDKHGIIKEIVKWFDSESDAYDFEIKAIKILKWIGCRLTNYADGGEGGLKGKRLTEDHKRKLREAKLGKKQSPEHARKSASAKKGKKQPKDAIEITRKARSKKVINSDGHVFDSCRDAAEFLSNTLKKKCYQGLISMCASNKRNNAYGLTWSYDLSHTPKFKPTKYAEKRVTNGIKEFKSVQEAVEWVESIRGSARNQCISASARSDYKKAYGYKWEYVQ